MPHVKLINFLLEHNRVAVEDYANPDNALWRRQYKAKHPTEIAALKCMDGRLNLPLITNTPVGILNPFRNIGGKFDLGWPFFGLLLQSWVNDVADRGHDAIILVTYHYSKSDTHRGCAGWNYDTEGSRRGAFMVKTQAERVFGTIHSVVYPIVIGVETDEDALIIHGENGEVLSIAEEKEVDTYKLQKTLRRMFPGMKQQIADDIIPLLLGNFAHVASIRKEERPLVDAEHREQIMAIGRGFDWLHLLNKALIIGPFSFDLREPIVKAAGILLSNLKEGKIPKEEGVVVMTSATFHDETGAEKLAAVEKAYALARLAKESIATQVPELSPHVHYLVGTVNLNTRAYNRLPFEEGTDHRQQ